MITIKKYIIAVVLIILFLLCIRKPKSIAVLNQEKFEIDRITVTYNGKELSLLSAEVEGSRLMLPAEVFGGEGSLSLFEITEKFNLVCSFNQGTNTIDLYSNDMEINPNKVAGERNALIRLEDVAPLGDDARADFYMRLRIIADYLYSQGVPFCIALVPRYINPEHELDNDPANKYSFSNLEFVYTIDYLIGRGGTVGLHGYTHQQKLGRSLDDIEFGEDVSLEEAEALFRLAKDAAAKMGFEPKFFVFPHYVCTDEQLAAAIREFGIVYQSPNKMVTYFPTENGLARTVPTPLGYFAPTDDVETKISEVEELPQGTLMSFFFHPYIEYESISIVSRKGDIQSWHYDENSLLHKVIRAAHSVGAEFVPITEIR